MPAGSCSPRASAPIGRASTLIFVAGLASPELHVEIDAWASRA